MTQIHDVMWILQICTYMYLCKLLRTYVRTERSVKETAKDGAKERKRERVKKREGGRRKDAWNGECERKYPICMLQIWKKWCRNQSYYNFVGSTKNSPSQMPLRLSTITALISYRKDLPYFVGARRNNKNNNHNSSNNNNIVMIGEFA